MEPGPVGSGKDISREYDRAIAIDHVRLLASIIRFDRIIFFVMCPDFIICFERVGAIIVELSDRDMPPTFGLPPVELPV